jgi:hypothetical protein
VIPLLENCGSLVFKCSTSNYFCFKSHYLQGLNTVFKSYKTKACSSWVGKEGFAVGVFGGHGVTTLKNPLCNGVKNADSTKLALFLPSKEMTSSSPSQEFFIFQSTNCEGSHNIYTCLRGAHVIGPPTAGKPEVSRRGGFLSTSVNLGWVLSSPGLSFLLAIY